MENKISTLIIDDEEDGRETLRLFIEDYCPEVEVVGLADSRKSGLQAIQKASPDLVFLDIELPDGSGFDLLKELGTYDFQVVFVTAYDQHAIRAFKVSAIDYLLKPTNPEELIQAVERARKQLQNRAAGHNSEALLKRMEMVGWEENKVRIPEGKQMKFVRAGTILHCRSESNYTHIYLKDGRKLFIAKTMKWVESLLAAYPFFRVHASHLINLREIESYSRIDGGVVELSDGSKIPISVSKRKDFLRIMGI
ncbi:MAG: LytTR family DNA-binding domain-containing protein [Bacteroidota bacterium]